MGDLLGKVENAVAILVGAVRDQRLIALCAVWLLEVAVMVAAVRTVPSVQARLVTESQPGLAHDRAISSRKTAWRSSGSKHNSQSGAKTSSGVLTNRRDRYWPHGE
jgi:hypothetical protein